MANSPCIFTKGSGDDTIYFRLYVDDFIYFSKNKSLLHEFEIELQKQLNIDFDHAPSHFLGMKLDCTHNENETSIVITQPATIEALRQILKSPRRGKPSHDSIPLWVSCGQDQRRSHPTIPSSRTDSRPIPFHCWFVKLVGRRFQTRHCCHYLYTIPTPPHLALSPSPGRETCSTISERNNTQRYQILK